MLTILWDAKGGEVLYTEFLSKDRRRIPTGVVQTYDHSSKHPQNQAEETSLLCITTTQGHIAVHKLRTPLQA